MIRHQAMRTTGLTFLLFLGLWGCASEPQVTINLANGSGITTSSNPFVDAAVIDVIFVITSVAPTADVTDSSGNVVIPAGTILDGNNDNIADTLIYPEDCGTAAPANCGFSPKSPEYKLSGVALNQRYTISIRFRNANAQVLYQGTSAVFDNIQDAAAVTITVDKVV